MPVEIQQEFKICMVFLYASLRNLQPTETGLNNLLIFFYYVLSFRTPLYLIFKTEKINLPRFVLPRGTVLLYVTSFYMMYHCISILDTAK
jgi:hypothetical protein